MTLTAIATESQPHIKATTSPASYSVAELRLTNFRNYESFKLEIGTEPVVITGKNGTGKTNLLEAISFLSPGKGLRGAKLAEIDYFTPEAALRPFSLPWVVAARVRMPSGESHIGTGREEKMGSDKRIVKIDGEQQRGTSSLGKVFASLAVTPMMDRVFVDGITARRNYLDSLVESFNAEHRKHLFSYTHAKAERKKLLRDRWTDTNWLAALESRMAENAVAIAASRLETVSRLNHAIELNSPNFPKAILTVLGAVETDIATMPALQVEENLKDRFARARLVDRDTGRTSEGTHLSDFTVYHREKKMPAQACSTGEQKALLLSITLAAAQARREWFGIAPVLLLDEVVAHLDNIRRGALAEAIHHLGAQAFMTGTDTALFQDFSSTVRFLATQDFLTATRA